MRCRRHPSDTSSIVGVCASCLRERLFTLISVQARQLAIAPTHAETEVEDRRKSDAQHHHPPSLIFPRSVSPYIYRHRTNDDSSSGQPHQSDQRFFRTPQGEVGSTTSVSSASTTAGAGAARKKKHGVFSVFSTLFGSKAEETVADNHDHKASRGSKSRSSVATSPPSSSSPISKTWLSGFIPNRSKKQSRLFSLEDNAVAVSEGGRRVIRGEDRGLSPVRPTGEDDYEDSSTYSSDCSPRKWNHGLKPQMTPPLATPTRARRRGRNVSGLAVCFSPLVRPSPPSPRQHHRSVGVHW